MAQPAEDSVEVYEHLKVPPDQLRKATLAASVGITLFTTFVTPETKARDLTMIADVPLSNDTKGQVPQ
ncbi:MAG TPA: hypothetical protein VIU11_07870 [Nakamurella sp.]